MIETSLSPIERKHLSYAPFRIYHENYFASIGHTHARYYCKSYSGTSNYPHLAGRLGFFKGEMEEDIYFEITSFTPSITDETRQLYKLKYKPHYRSDTDTYLYVDGDKSPSKHPMWFVHLDDCERIVKPQAKITPAVKAKAKAPKKTAFSLAEILEDMPYEKMTARDHICVALKIQRSNHAWINEIIEQSL